MRLERLEALAVKPVGLVGEESGDAGKAERAGRVGEVVGVGAPELAAHFDGVVAVNPAQGVGNNVGVVAAALRENRRCRRTVKAPADGDLRKSDWRRSRRC